MSSPVVSVLMPVYNARRYVAAAVESILAQTFTDFEFIIVDDGSTDGSTQILQEFARRDSRITLISRPNTGLVKALNEGLGECRGEFIARMDADDVSLPERFEKQVAYLKAHPECVVLGSNWVYVDEEGDELGGPREFFSSHEDLDSRLLAGRSYLVHPVTMIRGSVLRQLEGYRDWPIGEDTDLWLRMAEQGRLANLPEVLIRYRYLPSSYTRVCMNLDVMNSIIADAYQRRRLTGPAAKRELPSGSGPEDASLYYASRAIRGGIWRTARKHSLRYLRRRPLAPQSWKLLVKVMLRIS